MSRRAAGSRIGLVVLAAACALACGDRGGGGAPARRGPPLPAAPVPLDLGQQPIVNPLNLWEMMIEGSPDHETVGVIGAQRVTTRELDDASDRLLTRIGDRIYTARDRGWRALLEQEGLVRAAAAKATSVEALLTAAYRELPAPTAAELDAELERGDHADLPAADRKDAARSRWRLARWLVRRSMLIDLGLRGVPRERAQLMLVNPDFAPATTAIGKIGDRRVTRAELHLAAGYDEQLARREYVEAARMLFDRRVREVLLAGAAAAARITVPELEARERASLGPPPPAEVARFVAENPAYAAEPARAIDAVRTLREVGAADALVARLAQAQGVRFLLVEPPIDRISPAVLAPRRAGNASAPHLLEIMHCVGGDTCARGSSLVRALVDRFGPRLRVELGDAFSGGDTTRLRHALALRCAEEQQRGWHLLERLLDVPTRAATRELLDAARAAGLDARPFGACLADDRHLPSVVENLRRAEQLGLELNIPGLWIDGARLDRLGEPEHVRTLIETAISN